jgi:hypothetical protein
MPSSLVEVDDNVEDINIENILNIKREDMVTNWEEVELHEFGHQEEQELVSLT